MTDVRSADALGRADGGGRQRRAGADRRDRARDQRDDAALRRLGGGGARALRARGAALAEPARLRAGLGLLVAAGAARPGAVRQLHGRRRGAGLAGDSGRAAAARCWRSRIAVAGVRAALAVPLARGTLAGGSACLLGLGYALVLGAQRAGSSTPPRRRRWRPARSGCSAARRRRGERRGARATPSACCGRWRRRSRLGVALAARAPGPRVVARGGRRRAARRATCAAVLLGLLPLGRGRPPRHAPHRRVVHRACATWWRSGARPSSR